jgi:ADP-heptose:LPS heptosyltransferase/lauroyl/myristoyl acyltransferase
MPESVLAAACRGLGWAIATLPTRRRRTLRSNLHHAFPEKSPAWIRAQAVESAQRSLEMGLLVLCASYFSRAQIAERFSMDEDLQKLFEDYRRAPGPLVLLVPHFSMMESGSLFLALVTGPVPPMGAIYRPFDAPGIERWVKHTRERWGLRLLSRKEGYYQAVDLLRENGAVVLLFDQNAGNQGALTLFCDRVCSSTELGGILVEKCRARVGVFYAQRRGFFRATIHAGYLDTAPRAAEVVFAANRWLENKLRADDQICADWLWMHSRWRHQDEPARRFRLQSKRDLLPAQLAWMGLSDLPKRTRFWIRLPNWLGDVVMAVPLLRALRRSRPDAELTLLAQPALAPLLERFGVGDRVVALPPHGPGYFPFFRRLREGYPDVHVLLTNSARGDAEAWLAGAPQRFGMARPGRWRPLLTHAWRVPHDLDETREHQTRVWERFFRHFGLEGDLDFAPFPRAAGMPAETAPVIGLICGTENLPAKRWPVEHWHTLAAALLAAQPGARLRLFGTARDEPIAAAVAQGLPADQISNLAGRTSLTEFADALSGCHFIVCNDTGGMHLANALGVPVAALYGPTNPVRTGPVFDAPRLVIQPPGCPPTGGASLAELAPARVFEALRPWLDGAAL